MANEEKEGLPSDPRYAEGFGEARALAREGYWTPLEKYVRDYLFTPVTWILGFIPHAANMLTISRLLIVFWAMLDLLFYRNPIERQVWFLTIAWITDLLDGSTARNNNNVTAFGTIADHTADFFLTLWMLFLSFYITLGFSITSPLEELAVIAMYAVLLLTTMGMFLVAIGMWLLKCDKRAERPNQPYFDFMREFLLKDLVTTVGARIHTGLAAFGIIFYLAGAIWKNTLYLQIGVVILTVQLFSMGFYLHEIWQARYEDRAYKIRQGLEKRVKELEEMFKKRKD